MSALAISCARNEVRVEAAAEDGHVAVLEAGAAVADLDPPDDRARPGLSHGGRVGVGHLPENRGIGRRAAAAAVQAVGRESLSAVFSDFVPSGGVLVRLRDVQREIARAALAQTAHQDRLPGPVGRSGRAGVGGVDEHVREDRRAVHEVLDLRREVQEVREPARRVAPVGMIEFGA